MLQETINSDKLSLIAGLSLHRFYFRIHEGSINGERAAEILGVLPRHMAGQLLVIWDGAAIHRSQPLNDLHGTSAGRL